MRNIKSYFRFAHTFIVVATLFTWLSLTQSAHAKSMGRLRKIGIGSSLISLTFNGNTINKVQQVYGGQRINLLASPRDPNAAFGKTSWKISGPSMGHYITSQSVAQLQDISDDNFQLSSNRASIYFYWWKRGTYTATFSSSVTIKGVTKPVSRTVTFKVFVPQLSLQWTTPHTITLINRGTAGGMIFGVANPNTPLPFGPSNPPTQFGIDAFVALVSGNVSNNTYTTIKGSKLAFVQVSSLSEASVKSSSGRVASNGPGTSGLDGEYPTGPAYLSGDKFHFHDAPAIAADNNEDSIAATMTNNFTLYLVFQPPGAGSVPVPVDAITWGLSSKMVWTGTSWALASGAQYGSYTISTVPSSSLTPPEWSQIVSNNLTFH